MITYKVKNQNLNSKINFTQSTIDLNKLQINHSSNKNLQKLSIDSRILPLFRNPLLRKKNEEIQVDTNKYNLNIKNLQSNLKHNFSNQILKIFLKGITLYNLNLKNFLLQDNQLNLILNLKIDKLYHLNYRISNFFNRVNKLLFDNNAKIKLQFNYNDFNNNRKTLIKKSGNLFARPTEFNSSYHYGKIINKDYGFRKLLINHQISTANLEMEIENNKELIKLGKEIITDLDYQISQNKLLININKKNNKVLDLVRNTSLFSLDNSKLNYNQINSIKHFISGSQTEELNYNNKILILNKIFNSINKSNEIKIQHTMNSLFKSKEFDYKTDSISIYSNSIPLVYKKNNNSIQIGNGKVNNISKSPVINKYLQTMSKYNFINKGISIYYSNIIGYKFNNENNKLIKNIYNLLVYSFKSMYCLISKPVFVFTANKVIIQLFYYLFIPNILKSKKIYSLKRRNNLRFYLTWKKRRNRIKKLYRKFRKINLNTRNKLRNLSLYNISNIFPNKFQNLCEILNNLFKKPVELDLIRLHYPYNDSNILANLLAIMINRIKLRILIKKLFGNAILKNKKFSNTNSNKINIIPAFLSGINIKVAGRLLNNKIVPRKTVKTITRGAIATGKINYLDVARFTNKNKRGAYSITVSSGHKFF